MENNNSKSEGYHFDTSGGISVEEQQEILKKINTLTVEKGIVQEDRVLAKKRGFFFPLLVNVAAVIILALGFSLLWVFHNRDDQDIRAGSAVLDPMERKLIQEIRRETNLRLSEKENQISDILLLLNEAGEEYQKLQFASASLSDEQKQRAEYLLGLQTDYRSTLSLLQNERTKILDDARLQEQQLRLQAEDKAQDFSSLPEDFERLSNDQERAAYVAAQLGGFYTSLNNQINSAAYNDAVSTLAAMKDYLNSPIFLTSRSLEYTKQNQLAAIAAIEKTLANSSGVSVSTDPNALAELNQTLEQKIEEQERTIAALNSSDSERSKVVADYEKTISDLRSEARNSSSNYEQRITQLNSTNSQMQTRIDDLTRTNSNTQQRINNLPAVIQQALEDQSIQDLLGPTARQNLQRIIAQAVQDSFQ